MPKRVLDVGNCDPDHGAIKRLMHENFAAEVVRAHTPASALAELRKSAYDLVLVNRLMDIDGTPGSQLIDSIQSDDQLKQTPVMMITNFTEHQQAAVAAGAVQGFGKAVMGEAATIEILKPYLV